MLQWIFAKIISNNKVDIPQIAADNNRLTGIFNAVLAVAGVVAVVIIVVAGIQFILSQGDPGKIKVARDAILYAVIGLVVVLSAFVILKFVIGQF